MMSRLLDEMYETALGMYKAGSMSAEEFAEFTFLKDQDKMPEQFYVDENTEDETMVDNCTDEQLIQSAQRYFPSEIRARDQLHHIANELAYRFGEYKKRHPELSDEDLKAFHDALDAPPKPNENLAKLLRGDRLHAILDYAENGHVTLDVTDCPLCTIVEVDEDDWKGKSITHCSYHKALLRACNRDTIYDDEEE
jgi:hypothetical protein